MEWDVNTGQPDSRALSTIPSLCLWPPPAPSQVPCTQQTLSNIGYD